MNLTKETAKKFIPILEAYAAGTPIQLEVRPGEWHTFLAFSFDAPPEKYRIKPEILDVNVWYKKGHNLVVILPTQDTPTANEGYLRHGWERKRLREVLE